MATYLEHFKMAYTQTTLEFGSADIFTDASGDGLERTASFILLMKLATRGGKEDHVRGALVIAPAHEVQAQCDQISIEEAVVKAAEVHFQRVLTPEEVTVVSQFVTVVHTANLQVDSVLECLNNAGEEWAVIVLQAGLYRAERAASTESSYGVSLPEDLWVPHLVELTHLAIPIAKEKRFYLLLDTGESAPLKPGNIERIRGIQDCGVFGFRLMHDADQLVAERSAGWKELAKSGRLGPAFAAIDELPEWMDSHKAFLKLQVMHGIAPSDEILRVLRNDIPNLLASADSRAKLKLAQIAEGADDDDLARSLLRSSVDGLRSAEDLLLAVDVADKVREYGLADTIFARADSLFPNAASFLDVRLSSYVHQRRFPEVSKLLLDNPSSPIDPQLRFFYQVIGSALAGDSEQDLEKVLETIAQVTPEFTNWCQVICGYEAIERGDALQALEICMPSGERHLTASVASVVIAALRRALLDRQGQHLAMDYEVLIIAVEAVVRYLADNPNDPANRQRLITLLSAETAGILGLAIATALTSRLSASMAVSNAADRSVQSPDDPVGALETFRHIADWVEAESPLIPSLTTLPQALFQVSPDGVLWIIRLALKKDFPDLRLSNEEKGFDNLLLIALLLAPNTTDPDSDLDILRYAGARYIAASKSQKARNLAEQAIQTAGGRVKRKRLGWFAFADVYHRGQSLGEALLGMACVLSMSNAIPIEQVYQELSLLIRIYRDLRVFADARQLADRLLALCAEFHLASVYSERIRTLLLQIRMLEVLNHPETKRAELPILCQQAADHCAQLSEEGEELTPAVIVLAQAVQQSIAEGIAVRPEIQAILAGHLAALPSTATDLVRLIDPAAASGQELFSFARTIQAAKNAEDTAFDLMPLGVATRRFLDSDIASWDAITAAFAIEALTNHAIKGSLAAGASPFEAIERSLAMARDMNVRGFDVLMLALSEKGSLVMLHVADGEPCPTRESSDVFSGEKFLTWKEIYPYGYGTPNEPMNLFYQTLEKIGVSVTLRRSTLLVMDNALQQLPPNLIMTGGNFAGRAVPMASAPSLSWVWQTMSLAPTNVKRTVWISTEVAEDRNPALTMIADRLEQTFAERGFELHTSTVIPDELAECEIAIVAAHGSILPEGRYIQRISNDASLTLYPSALANAMRHSTVAILFICSGGRLDSHPRSETTVGLVTQLLDEGCGTVIASPWPLDSRVPSHWLPAFLTHWDLGHSVAEATFKANEKVVREMGDSPAVSLAMNVFGNPVRRSSQR